MIILSGNPYRACSYLELEQWVSTRRIYLWKNFVFLFFLYSLALVITLPNVRIHGTKSGLGWSRINRGSLPLPIFISFACDYNVTWGVSLSLSYLISLASCSIFGHSPYIFLLFIQRSGRLSCACRITIKIEKENNKTKFSNPLSVSSMLDLRFVHVFLRVFFFHRRYTHQNKGTRSCLWKLQLQVVEYEGYDGESSDDNVVHTTNTEHVSICSHSYFTTASTFTWDDNMYAKIAAAVSSTLMRVYSPSGDC